MRLIKVKSLGFMVTTILVFMVIGVAWAKVAEVQRDQVEIKKDRGAFFPTIYVAKNGEKLNVLEEVGNWWRVETPKGPGWVFAPGLSQKTAKVGTGGDYKGGTGSSDLDQTAGFKGVKPPDADKKGAVPPKEKEKTTKKSAVTTAGAKVDERMLYRQKCGLCHSHKKPLKQKHNNAEWLKIVKSMQAKKPDHISNGEVTILADYLTKIRGK